MECSGFCKNWASFPVMCYLIDFIDTAHTVHNFLRRTKLVSSFFKNEIELIISKMSKFLFRSVIFHGIFWSGNSIILEYSLSIDLEYLQIAGAFRLSFLDSIAGFTPPDPMQVPMNPSCIGKHITCWLRDDLLTFFFLLFFKISSSQIF